MKQIARNLTDAEGGFLQGKAYLIMDRDTKYTREFRSIPEQEGIKSILCPVRAPNCNAFAERLIRSVKEECLHRVILWVRNPFVVCSVSICCIIIESVTTRVFTINVRDSKRIIALLDQAAISLHSNPLDGFVRVGIAEEYGGIILPCVLSRFSKMYPDAEVTVHCASSSELRREFDRGELDLVVLHEDVAMIGGELLLNDPVLWVTSDAHFQHECNPMPVAVCERECWWRDWALALLDQRQK